MSLRNTLKHIITYTVFRPYYSVRTAWPVWNYVLNREGRRLYRKHALPENSAVKQAINDVREYGIAVTHLDDLFPGEHMLEKLQAYYKNLPVPDEARANKSFLVRLEGIGMGDTLNLKSPLVELSLRNEVLAVIAGYIGMLPKFFFYSLEITKPVGADASRVKSQRWHRDPEDKRMCKMFVYLNDVGLEAGPFTYVKGSHYGGSLGKFFPHRPPVSYYPPDGEVEKRMPKDAVRTMTGKAGTVIFCDTNGIHRGGYATTHERIMLTVGFASKALIIPIPYEYSKEFAKESSSLTPQARYALDKNLGSLITFLNSISRFAKKRGLFVDS